MSLARALQHLKHSRPLFEALSAGKHLDASQEPQLWSVLCSDEFDHYEQLFGHLGKKLVKNPRGYAYFEIEDTESKGTRPLALFYLLLFQKQADAGQDLNQFNTWLIDPPFLQELRAANQELLRSENLENEDRWKSMLNKAVNLGFLAREGSSIILLPATWRFLDLFLELSDELQEPGESENGNADEEVDENTGNDFEGESGENDGEDEEEYGELS